MGLRVPVNIPKGKMLVAPLFLPLSLQSPRLPNETQPAPGLVDHPNRTNLNTWVTKEITNPLRHILPPQIQTTQINLVNPTTIPVRMNLVPILTRITTHPLLRSFPPLLILPLLRVAMEDLTTNHDKPLPHLRPHLIRTLLLKFARNTTEVSRQKMYRNTLDF